MGKRALLVVSFGTSYEESRKKTIEVIEDRLRQEWDDYDFIRAFTSTMVIAILKKRDHLFVNNVKEAMEHLKHQSYESVLVQPTHMINGIENEEMLRVLSMYTNDFKSIHCGTPLLTSKKDYKELATILVEETVSFCEERTAIVFMGHGSTHWANQAYTTLDQYLKEMGKTMYFVGTVEATPTLFDVMEQVKRGRYKKVVLLPLMVVAGDHVINDMAGDEEGSWKYEFEKEGIEVTVVLKGLGEYESVRRLFLNHAKDAKPL